MDRTAISAYLSLSWYAEEAGIAEWTEQPYQLTCPCLGMQRKDRTAEKYIYVSAYLSMSLHAKEGGIYECRGIDSRVVHIFLTCPCLGMQR